MGNSKSRHNSAAASSPASLSSRTSASSTSSSQAAQNTAAHPKSSSPMSINTSPRKNQSRDGTPSSGGSVARKASNLSVDVPQNSLNGHAYKLNLHSPSDPRGKLPKGILEGCFEEHWEMKGEVGRGATSRVYVCELKTNNNVRGAVKVVNKNRLGFGRRKKNVLEHIRNEIDVLKSLDHPCIIRILASYESDDYIHIVTELMEGGELFEYIVDEAAHLTEKEASNIVSRVARALDYMHSKGVLHRDLKPENMLLKKPGDPSEVKIIDFGFSKNCIRTESFLGTHGYLAPEMMAHEEYTMAVDMWALGVCVYALISGYLPFDELEMPEPGCEIEWVVEFPEEQWLTVSTEAKDLIERLLEPDPARRLTARQVLSHPWVSGVTQSAHRLLSPANLRMLSPAKSARRSGGWKFWDDKSSRRGSSPSLASIPSPSPGNPSPLRNSINFPNSHTPSGQPRSTSGHSNSPLSSPDDPNKLPESAAAPPEPATPAEKRTSLAHVDLVDEVEAPVMVGTPSNAGMLAKTAE